MQSATFDKYMALSSSENSFAKQWLIQEEANINTTSQDNVYNRFINLLSEREFYVPASINEEIKLLIQDSANSSGAKIHEVISNAILDDRSFNYCINMLSSYKNEKELDIVISILSKHPIAYFNRVLVYASDEKMDKYIRYYLIEAISKWYTVDEKTKKNALWKIFENTSNHYIKIVIQDTMEEI